MTLDSKPLESVNEQDLQNLVDNKVVEGKNYEYKQSFPGNTDKEKKEFLADVSSFANAAGGHLILGMKEEGGVALEVCGFSVSDPDSVVLRLDGIIRDGMEPRIPGVAVKPVQVKKSKLAIVIRIPRSWALPHMVTFKGQSKFYSRNSAGKYQLDVAELRELFALSQNTAERIRSFRAERLSMVVAGETPVPINDSPKIVLHIVPIAAFGTSAKFDVEQITKRTKIIRPIYSTGITGERHNFDGFLTYDQFGATGEGISYLQIFRNGVIEAVDTKILHFGKRDKKLFIPSIAYERELLEALPRFLHIQKELGVQPPLFVMLSLLGVSGYMISVDRGAFPAAERDKIDRDALVIPEVLIETFDIDVAHLMRPVFDTVWNASGWSRSHNYNENGEWVGK